METPRPVIVNLPAVRTRRVRLFRSPASIVLAARIALLLIGAELAVLAMAAGSGAIRPTPLFWFVAGQFNGLAGLMLAMLAMPWFHRHDLLRAVLGSAAALLAAGTFAGWDGAPAAAAGLTLGALATYLPAGVERQRRRAREYGDELMEIVEIEERRRRAAETALYRPRASSANSAS